MKFVLVVGQFIYLGKERSALSEERTLMIFTYIYFPTSNFLGENYLVSHTPPVNSAISGS